jgi:hypothetical protein
MIDKFSELINSLSELEVGADSNDIYVHHIRRGQSRCGSISKGSDFACSECGKKLNPQIKFILDLRSFTIKSK